nr:PD-(D/E)XK nuclease domain-containing protein [Parabacteroides sp.]
AEEAIRQIDDRGYLIPYTADEREVVKVGVAFDAATRNLGEWLIEKTL